VISAGARAGLVLIAAIALVSVAAPAFAPHDPGRQFPDMSYAPPMLPHLFDAQVGLERPFVYPVRLVDRLQHTFTEDRTARVPLVWFHDGAIVTTNRIAAVETAATIWLRVSDEQNRAIEMNSAPTSSTPM
jgi:hypothetical protein